MAWLLSKAADTLKKAQARNTSVKCLAIRKAVSVNPMLIYFATLCGHTLTFRAITEDEGFHYWCFIAICSDVLLLQLMNRALATASQALWSQPSRVVRFLTVGCSIDAAIGGGEVSKSETVLLLQCRCISCLPKSCSCRSCAQFGVKIVLPQAVPLLFRL